MIVRAVSVLVLLALYHAAGVHGFAGHNGVRFDAAESRERCS